MLCLVSQSCLTLCDTIDCSPPGSSVLGDSPGKNTGVGCHVLLQGIFTTQGLNSGFPHCRWTLYHLSHQGSPRILNWIAYPFSSGSSLHCRQSLYQLSYHKESLQFNNKDTTNQMKQWAKDLNENFSKEDIQMSIKHMKRCSRSSVQFSSVPQSCLTLCDPMDCSMPGLPVHHQLPELFKTHVHQVSDAIQPSHSLSSPSPPPFNLSQHQSFQMSQFFTSSGQSIGVSVSASVLQMNIQD